MENDRASITQRSKRRKGLTKKESQQVAVIGGMMDLMIRGVTEKVNKRLNAELGAIYTRLEELEEMFIAVKKKLKNAKRQQVIVNIEQEVLTKFAGHCVRGKKDKDIIADIRTNIDSYIKQRGYSLDLLPYYVDVDTNGDTIKKVRLMPLGKRSG